MLVKAIQKFPSLKDLIPSLNQNKIYIYPNVNGIVLGLFIFFCFLISVFYQINSGLLVSIIIFFIFFISIFVSHQNINNLEINFNKEYLLEAEQNEILNFQILNLTDEKKLNIDIIHNNKKIGNFNFKKKLTALRLEYQNSLRGEFYLNKLILKSIYPFGVIRTKTNFYPKTKIIVYPKKIKPTDLLLSEFAISKNIKKHYQRQFNLKNKRIDVLPSGTALKFDYIFTKNKKNLNIGYFGSINYSKGINTILKLSKIDRSNKYYICGGLKEQVSEIKIKFNQENLNVLSHQDYKKLPKIISKMDILLMPYTKSVTAAGNVSDITKFTSPLKLFDYMAAGKTIMCSDIPVFKEIIKDKRNCIIVKNFINPFSWLMELNKIKNNFYLRNILARNSINDVKNFHHDKRAKKYLQGVK